jgi:hypothetical protein
MEVKIIGFHQDESGDWVAVLSCGHTQHVRHRPPWEVRTWVTTAAGRAERIGQVLVCKKCVQQAHDGN